MFTLLVWLILGAVLGALANGARWGLRQVVARHGGWWTLALGALATLLGGLLGGWLFGPALSGPAAICIGALSVVGMPLLIGKWQARKQARLAHD